MSAKSAEEIRGLEFDWLASDADGHVAFFSTAGGGYAPAGFLRDTDRHQAAIQAILALPISTTVRFARELPPACTNTWRMMAERGLFAYDGDFNGGPYELVAAPITPIRVADLPTVVAEAFDGVEFHHMRFAEFQVVFAELLQRRVAD